MSSQSIAFDSNDILGEGTFGSRVYNGKVFDTTDAAIKIVKFSNKFPTEILKEIKHHFVPKTLHEHPNILKYFCVDLKNDLCIAMELSLKNLSDYVANDIAKENVIPICKQILAGVSFLHDIGIVHGNLNPSNILVHNILDNLTVKTSDYGMTNIFPLRWKLISDSSHRLSVTEWMPPEILRQLQENSENKIETKIRPTYLTDIYSTGCLVYFVISKGQHLFGKKLVREMNILLDRKSWRTIDIHLDFQPILYIIYFMTHKNGNTRPEISTLQTFCNFWDLKTYLEFLVDINTLLENSPFEVESCVRSLCTNINKFELPSAMFSVTSLSLMIHNVQVLILRELGFQNPKRKTFETQDYFGIPTSYIRLLFWESFLTHKNHPKMCKYYEDKLYVFPKKVADVMKLLNSKFYNHTPPVSTDSNRPSEHLVLDDFLMQTIIWQNKYLFWNILEQSALKFEENPHEVLCNMIINTTKLSHEEVKKIEKNIDLWIEKYKDILYHESPYIGSLLHLKCIHVDLLRHLITRGASVTATNNESETLMHICPSYLSAEDYHKLVVLICNRHEDNVFSIRSASGKVPLFYAVKYFDVLEETLVLLKEKGQLHLNSRSYKWESILEQAVENERSESSIKLLEKYAKNQTTNAEYEVKFHDGIHAANYTEDINISENNGIILSDENDTRLDDSGGEALD